MVAKKAECARIIVQERGLYVLQSSVAKLLIYVIYTA